MESNHPPSIIRQIPRMIERLVLDNSSNAEIFKRSKAAPSEALRRSGYRADIKYILSNGAEKKQRKKLKRWLNEFWYNPSFYALVKTDVIRGVLQIVNKHFPPHSKWRRHFYRHYSVAKF